MSLFITELAFATPDQLDAAKMAILIASLIAGVGGWLLLRWMTGPVVEAQVETYERAVRAEARERQEARELAGTRR